MVSGASDDDPSGNANYAQEGSQYGFGLSLLSYVVVLGFVRLQWGDALLHLVVPHVQFTRAYVGLVVAVLGTTISPYLFFWQSAHRVEELREEPEGGDRALPLAGRSERVK